MGARGRAELGREAGGLNRALTPVPSTPGETRRILSVQPTYDWTCFSHSLLNVSPMPVESSPPLSCPTPCHLLPNCTSCLDSKGADGGWQHCVWSSSLQQVPLPVPLCLCPASFSASLAVVPLWCFLCPSLPCLSSPTSISSFPPGLLSLPVISAWTPHPSGPCSWVHGPLHPSCDRSCRLTSPSPTSMLAFSVPFSAFGTLGCKKQRPPSVLLHRIGVGSPAALTFWSPEVSNFSRSPLSAFCPQVLPTGRILASTLWNTPSRSPGPGGQCSPSRFSL